MAELVIKPLGRGVGRTLIHGWELSAAEADDLQRRIEAEPYAWVGQEALAGSTAPSVVAGGLVPNDLMLRAFAVASGTGYQVMTGALAQVRTHHGGLTHRQNSPISKDVWIRNTRGAPAGQPWVHEATASQVLPLTLPPRVIENMFWLGRYAERAEDTRSTAAGRHRPLGGLPRFTGAGSRRDVAGPAGRPDRGHLDLAGLPRPGRLDPYRRPEAELRALILDDTRPGSLAYSVRRLTEVAGDVREQMSTDTWLVLGSLDGELSALRAAAGVDGRPSGPDARTPTAIARVLEACSRCPD